MGGLIGLVKPLLPVMFLAVLLGTLGYLCAIFLTILAGYGLLQLFFEAGQPGTLFAALGILAVLRGLFHYGEQYCNHFIAFKLLALIRHKVFAALRRLCPAKLEGKDKGNLISMITTDVELLEVFYAPHHLSHCHCRRCFPDHDGLYREVFPSGGNPGSGSLRDRGSGDPPDLREKRRGKKACASGTASGISTALCWIPSGAWMRPSSTAGENREEKPWSGGRRIWAGCRKN